MRRVLVIEESESLRQALVLALHGRGIEADSLGVLSDAARTPQWSTYDVVVLDTTGNGIGDLAALTAATRIDVVAITNGDFEDGLRALRAGACDFVSAAAGVDGVTLVLRKIEARRAFVANVKRMTRSGNAGGGASGATVVDPTGPSSLKNGSTTAQAPVLVGSSAKIEAVLTLIRRLAGVRAGVLVGGESGTGKELVAQALHDQSPWRAGPFIAVNCGAIPAGLIESELFGHVRGAFTDAVRDKQGLFQAAHGGTLFLDEIADLPLGLQSKLLRAIQEGDIRRVGDVDDIKVDVRVVAATARDLPREVAARQFREDLYYRLAGLTIQLPALRERREDIPLLANHFLARARTRLGVAVHEIDADALRLLAAYSWPGNVRELENTIERAAVLCSGDRIDVASLPDRMVPPIGNGNGNGDRNNDGQRQGSPPRAARDGADENMNLSIKQAARRSEEDLIRRALHVTGGNRTRAAELLEISHRALLYKIKEYRVSIASGREAPPSRGDPAAVKPPVMKPLLP